MYSLLYFTKDRNCKPEDIDIERKIFERAGSIDYCEHKLLEIKDRAVSHLEILPESEAKQSLFDLAEWSVLRET